MPKSSVIAMGLAVLLLLTPSASAEIAPELLAQHEQMLYPVVQVEGKGGLGSGTVIFSAEHDGEVKTFVLTNHHVIDSSISVGKEWDPQQGKKVDRERRQPVKVFWWQYNDLSREIGTRGQTADIVAYDAARDLALLRTRDKEMVAPHVANLIPPDKPLYLFEPVWAVGSGLGKPPFPTAGMLSNLDQRFESYRYLLSSAPIIFGNSGGALFRFSTERGVYELIGVPSAVSGAWLAGPIEHMAWSIPMDTVREFLAENQLGFLVGVEDVDPPPEEATAEED